MLKDKLGKLREEYRKGSLSVSEILSNPFDQFGKWLEEAINSEIKEPNSMSLATSTSDGRPSTRMVLLKEFDKRGFVFYTNFNSQKGRELDQNNKCALLFYWKEFERQIRIEGYAEKVSDEESDAYFSIRPFESRLGAYISPQSEIIPGREYLEEAMERVKSQLSTGLVSRPEYWGGYRVYPQVFEFWQGRENRLHDRFQFLKSNENWAIHRLAP